MLRLFLRITSLTTLLLVGLVLAFLLQAAWPFFGQYGLAPLLETAWYPYEGLFGMLPALVGTLWAVLLALAVALPLAVAAAILNAELLAPRYRDAIRLLMELLAAVPSVVYGLLGMWLLLPFLEDGLDLLTGRSLLAAGLLLALMILPTLMILAQEALSGVVREQHETAALLGLDWTARLLRIALPQAWPGIRAATLLATGRALGETIAVMLVVGSIDRLPEPWYNLLLPAQTLTSRIGRELGEAGFGSLHWSALMACGLLLALLATMASLLSRRWRPL